ncbi:hypothetical protein LTR86_007050 [Recurvomyces mirabilis]|nr:hypothetical protein LTR86_007050 [Recurvomyces mirabilis]
MAGFRDDFESIKAQERFTDVALHVIGESNGRDELELTLQDDYNDPRILNSYNRALLDDLVNVCIGRSNEVSKAKEIAKQTRVSPAITSGPPSRGKVRAINTYSDNMEWLYSRLVDYQASFRNLGDRMIFRDDVPWSQQTRDLFIYGLQVNTDRVAEASDEASRALQQATEQAARPGQNPRKTRFWTNHQDVDMISTAIKSGLQSGPLELQPEQPSEIPPGNWLPAASLGGGMAQVALFVDVDHTGYITNRIVRKDTHIDRGDWADITRWYGNMNTTNLNERWPMEYYCQRLMAQISSTHVVMPLKCEVDAQRSVFRIYLPYCPYGDLSKLIEHYQMMSMQIPEAFIWRVFQVLCESGEIMEKGWLPPSGIDQAAYQGWRQIVHRDLKTNNVFLDAAPQSNINGNPQAKLADFGLAILTNADDPLNPRLYNRGAGTEGFLAPEQRDYVDRETRQPVDNFQLLAHTNVWGIGAIVCCLANLHDLGAQDQPSYLPTQAGDDGRPRYTIEPPEQGDEASHLSPALRDMIDACLKFDPSLRPTFSELRSRIDTWILENCADGGVGQYLFAASNGLLSEFDTAAPQHTLWQVQDQDYRIGFALDRERQAYEQRRSGYVGPEAQFGGASQNDRYSA